MVASGLTASRFITTARKLYEVEDSTFTPGRQGRRLDQGRFRYSLRRFDGGDEVDPCAATFSSGRCGLAGRCGIAAWSAPSPREPDRRAIGNGLRVNRSSVLRAGACGSTNDDRACTVERRLRHGGDQVDGTGQSASGRDGTATGRRVLVERARANAGAQVARRAGAVSVANARKAFRRRSSILTGYWTGFSARIRVIAYNTTAGAGGRGAAVGVRSRRSTLERAGGDRRPAVRLDVIPCRRALYRARRREGRRFFRRLRANDVRMVDGNSVVREWSPAAR